MKLCLLLFGCFVCLSRGQSPQCWYSLEDYSLSYDHSDYFQDLQLLDGGNPTTLEECMAACDATPKCGSLHFNPKDNTCQGEASGQALYAASGFSKISSSFIRAFKMDCVQEEPVCKWNDTTGYEKNYLSKEVSRMGAEEYLPTLSACKLFCESKSDCVAVSYRASELFCAWFAEIPTEFAEYKSATFSTKNCSPAAPSCSPEVLMLYDKETEGTDKAAQDSMKQFAKNLVEGMDLGQLTWKGVVGYDRSDAITENDATTLDEIHKAIDEL